MRFAAFLVKFDTNRTQKAVPLRFMKAHGSAEAEAPECGLYRRSEARYLDACHACVGDVRRVSAEYHLVRGLDVGVRAEYAAHPAREIVPHSLFLGGSLRVEVNEDVGRVYVRDKLVRLREGVVERVHEYRAHEVYHRYRVRAHVEHAYALARGAALGIVGGTDDVVAVKEVRRLPAREGVVARGYYVGSRSDEHICGFGRYSVACCGILAVHYRHIDCVMPLY